MSERACHDTKRHRSKKWRILKKHNGRRANSYEHREKLRKIFPYVLGAVTPALMAKQFELGRARQELRRKERDL